LNKEQSFQENNQSEQEIPVNHTETEAVESEIPAPEATEGSTTADTGSDEMVSKAELERVQAQLEEQTQRVLRAQADFDFPSSYTERKRKLGEICF
jgi:molecular chaperone GrpE